MAGVWNRDEIQFLLSWAGRCLMCQKKTWQCEWDFKPIERASEWIMIAGEATAKVWLRVRIRTSHTGCQIVTAHQPRQSTTPTFTNICLLLTPGYVASSYSFTTLLHVAEDRRTGVRLSCDSRCVFSVCNLVCVCVFWSIKRTSFQLLHRRVCLFGLGQIAQFAWLCVFVVFLVLPFLLFVFLCVCPCLPLLLCTFVYTFFAPSCLFCFRFLAWFSLDFLCGSSFPLIFCFGRSCLFALLWA